MTWLVPEEWARLGSAARKKMERQLDEHIVHRGYLDELRKLGILKDLGPNLGR